MAHTIKREGDTLAVCIQGHLDIKTAPELERQLLPQMDGIRSLTIDLAQVDYVSSMGLRLLLALQKRMAKQGTMLVLHPQDEVMKLFEESGFDQILTLAP